MVFIVSLIILILSATLHLFERTASLLFSLVLAWLAGTVSIVNSFDAAAYAQFYGFPVGTRIFERGYMLITYWSAQLGYSYETFRLVSYIIAYLIFYLGIIRLTQRPAVFFAFYAFFPFLDDATQVRNFLMFSIVVFAYSLVTNRKLFNWCCSALLIVIAAQFQTTGYLYLIGMVYLFVPQKYLKKAVNFSIGIFAAVILVAGAFWPVLFKALIPKLASISGRSNFQDSLSFYATQGSSHGTWLFLIAYVLLSVILLIQLNQKKLYLDEANQSNLLVLFLIGSIGVPLSIISESFNRIIRNSMMLMPLFIPGMIAIKNKIMVERKQYLKVVVPILVVVSMFGTGYFNHSYGHIGNYALSMLKIVPQK
ncbi:EpsG family protein [Furfurilactobacillus sp. WILCCON 0119]